MQFAALPLLCALASLFVVRVSGAPSGLPDLRDELSGLSPAQRAQVAELVARVQMQQVAKRTNPSGSYAPANVTDCPAAFNSSEPGGMTGYVRNATSQEINSQEADYIERHRKARQDDWTEWLSSASPGPNLNISGGVQNYTSTLSNIPKVGIAVSGGGYRAMLYGAGVIQGWDARNSTSSSRGLGGVLQRADYFAGLSGGSWLTGALAINDWPTPQQLNDEIFDLESNLILPSDNKLDFYTSIVSDVEAKKSKGQFPTSITDYWGRALSYHLLNSTKYPDHGAATTWSDIVNVTAFQNASMPFPVVMADEREPGDVLIYGNTTIWEFSPFEFGTWNRIQGFVETSVLGSTIENGKMVSCIGGYDSFGWVVGTSSTLFNGLFDELITSDGDSVIQAALTALTGAVDAASNDVSQVPNPLQSFENGVNSSAISDATLLSLTDGGEDDQNIPVEPLIQPARDLDFILALDSSADVSSWPNGTALYQSHLRAQTSGNNEVPFPYIPQPETFVNRGLNTRPVFFGCDASNATNAKTAAHNTKAPIVAYVPNYPYSGLTNFSTYKLEYDASESQLMLDNGVAIATLGGNNATWAQCLACGMLERSWERSGVERPSECTQCMDTYCWDGVEDNSTPANPYSPPVGMPEWVSDTSVQRAPAYTGGNGSSSTSTDSDSSDSGAMFLSAREAFGVAAYALVVASACMLL